MLATEAKSIFFDLLAIPEKEHAMYISRVCGENDDLKDRVQRLINAHLSAGEFLGETHNSLNSSGEQSSDAPDQIGPYRVIRELGEGGFGSVYLCQQNEPIKRLIAVKVLRPGMDTRTVLRRFEEERLLLSKMDHPGIARVLDAGKADTGRPYIAMEYIEGTMITTYCNANGLGLHARLEVFAQACQAVQHAHQKGVIHRDIKPGNVLVTEVDGRAVVKVIDFGVSKAFEEQTTDETITRTMQLVGTPQYMSPEQASAVSADIDTRTDVYSLGVMLYELSTGLPPFDAQKLRSASVGQLERLIREIDPQRPSSRVSNLEGLNAERISSQQSSSVGHIVRALKGEVDWVILKSMEKDRDRRYPTAYALYEDVRRVLAGEVVHARPPSKVYAVRKFVSRNTAGTVIAGLIILSLIMLTGLSLGYAQRINRANDRIQSTLNTQEQVLAFTEEMLGGIDPAVARGQDTALFMMILDSASDRVGTELSGTPEVEVRVRTLIGNLYRSIGKYEEAQRQFESAATTGIESLGKLHLQTISARSALGVSYVDLSDYSGAQGIFEDLHEDARESLGERHPDTLVIISDLVSVYHSLGDSKRAIELGEVLLKSRVEVLGENHDDTVSTRNGLALAYKGIGDLERASEMFEFILESQILSLGEDHPKTLKTRSNLALTYHGLELFDKSVEMNETILEQKRHVLGDEHPSVLVSMVNLGSALGDAGKEDQSRDMLTQALEQSLDTFGEQHQYTLVIQNNLAKYYYNHEEYATALTLAQASCNGLMESLGDRHPMTLSGRANLADILLDMGNASEALVLALDTQAIAAEVYEPGNKQLGMFSERLGKCYAAIGNSSDAGMHFEESLELYRLSHGVDSNQHRRVAGLIETLDRSADDES